MSDPIAPHSSAWRPGQHLVGRPSNNPNGRIISDPVARFFRNVDLDGECWMWTSKQQVHGYGRMYAGIPRRKVYVLAHRFAYEMAYGPIPDGLSLDHLCRWTLCVNPTHLEPVTHAENMRRGKWAQSDHCKKGHLYAEVGTYSTTGHRRVCRKCVLDWQKERRIQKRSAV